MIPSSWYYVARETDIKPGQILSKKVFGENLIIWKTKKGKLNVSSATCPHQGTNLGIHGKVVGENIECFSHKFQYDGKGNVVTTPQGLPCSTKNVLRQWDFQIKGDFVLVWYDKNNRKPEWSIPEDIFDPKGYGRYIKSQYTFKTTVETINKDNFDVGHIYTWHAAKGIESTLPEVDGPKISVNHGFHRDSLFTQKGFLANVSKGFRVEYGSTLYGQGLTFSYVRSPDVNFHTQDMIWVTPIDKETVQYTTFVRRRLPTYDTSLLQFIFDKVVHPIFLPVFVWGLRREHRHEGYGFWENETPLGEKANLTENEKPMLEPYYKWCKQFRPSDVKIL